MQHITGLLQPLDESRKEVILCGDEKFRDRPSSMTVLLGVVPNCGCRSSCYAHRVKVGKENLVKTVLLTTGWLCMMLAEGEGRLSTGYKSP